MFTNNNLSWRKILTISCTSFLLFSIGISSVSAQEKKPRKEKAVRQKDDNTKDATYPGGVNALYREFMKNFKIDRYPAHSIRVVATFFIETDGSLSKIEILEDPGYGAGPATVNALLKMKKWNPAIEDGEVVRSQFTVPITIQGSES